MKTILVVTGAVIFGTSLVVALLRRHDCAHALDGSADTHWNNAVKLTRPDTAQDDVFGFSVAIDGDWAVVGAPGSDGSGTNSGAAYAFQKGDGGIELGREDTSEYGEFGHAVAIRGRVAVVGKPGDGAAGENAGAAYLYRLDNRNQWSRAQRLVAGDAIAGNRFGESVAMKGGMVLVGSYGARASGSVYVFQENERGIWQQQAKLDPAVKTQGDGFGCHIAIDGGLVVVGASGANDNSGAAYLFERDTSGKWSELAALRPPNGRINCFFGNAVAIRDRTAVIGAPGIGSAFLFREDDFGNWQPIATLVRDDLTLPSGFGRSVAISAKAVMVGAPQVLEHTGATYVFKATSDGSWQHAAKITLPASPARSWFGNALAVSGNTLLVGARYGDGSAPKSGTAYLFELAVK